MGKSLKTRLVYPQELSAPDRAVITIPRSIPGYRQNWRAQPIVSQAGEGVGVVVLYWKSRKIETLGKSSR